MYREISKKFHRNKLFCYEGKCAFYLIVKNNNSAKVKQQNLQIIALDFFLPFSPLAYFFLVFSTCQHHFETIWNLIKIVVYIDYRIHLIDLINYFNNAHSIYYYKLCKASYVLITLIIVIGNRNVYLIDCY